jgi:hypothetical protein
MFAKCCESRSLAVSTTRGAVRRNSISEVRSSVAKDHLGLRPWGPGAEVKHVSHVKLWHQAGECWLWGGGVKAGSSRRLGGVCWVWISLKLEMMRKTTKGNYGLSWFSIPWWHGNH